MSLISARYGKARVRVMRLQRQGDRHIPRESTIEVLVQGAFESSYTQATNSDVVATDTMKNLVYVTAKSRLDDDPETFCTALAQVFLDRYAHLTHVRVTSQDTRWTRLDDHPHGFVLDGNGRDYVRVEMDRAGVQLSSGVRGYAFMKTTGSGFAGFLRDDATTLPETHDRICATSMDATWLWQATPVGDRGALNTAVLRAMVDVFVQTYSISVQDSMYRMGQAALALSPAIARIELACPNKHYIPFDLRPFGQANGEVFVPTDEPHGQIECVIGRD